MKIKNVILFIVPCLIWGTTWFAIKHQLGVVDPVVSIAYRLTIASFIFFVGCIIFKLNLRYTFRQHFFIALQGLSLFSVNFWLVYIAEQTLTSGLVSVIFSLVIFLNVLFNFILLKGPIRTTVIIGALFGFSGTYLVFKEDLMGVSLSDDNTKAIFYCLISVVLASLGNIISAYNQKNRIPVIQTNAYGMLYGAIIMYLIAFIGDIDFSFDMKTTYISSLLYLAIFGSVISSTLYLKLLGNIGPDRSVYIILLVPVLAMSVSTIFEGYIWQKSAIFGIILLLAGNYFALKKKVGIKKIKNENN